MSDDVSIRIKVEENNAKEFEAAMNKAMARALEKIGLAAEGYAKRLCPVDTGRLRNSIMHVVSSNKVYIGTNVEYGPFVELGTSRKRARPFLRPAAQDHADQYRTIVKNEMRG